ncbi:hypothetical protein FACS189427_07450 [Planctomycetales bacterium]|nr:hypothetical protein FACS189427_07450 [Planctomycetales bacterium]
MKKYVFALVVSITCICGCGGVPAPDELKNLVPVSVTVTDGGTPLDDVAVTLSPKTGGGAWASCGITDAKGVAVIQTTRASYTGKGAPAGDYKIMLIKGIKFPADLQPQETDQDLAPQAAAAKEAKRNDFLKKNRIIPEAFENAAKSPVDLTAAPKTGATLTVDISQYKK